jgi:DNA replication factor GINS
MDIDEIIAVWESCRNGEFKRLPEDFYETIQTMIDEREKKKAYADDDEYYRLEDEIRTLKRIRKDVFEARVNRILKMAWMSMCGCKVDEDSMIEAEKDLYRRIVELLEKFKSRIFGRKREEKVLVRIKKDIPEFEGVDGRVYRLRREDVVLLPKLNAKALVEGGIAEEVEYKR